MLLTLDVGNSQIYGGVFDGETLKLKFRKTSKTDVTSDELGVFLRGVLRESGLAPDSIKDAAVCSVVPDLAHPVRNCCLKYFGKEPFLLQPGVKTGLNIKYKNPAEVGADRIANAIAAVHRHPGKNLILIDLGTATTFCAVTGSGNYLGGIILPGLRISMEALATRTAKLPAVEIVRPKELLGRTTADSIQAGLFYGNLAAIRTISAALKTECFDSKDAIVIGTGGFSRLFEGERAFAEIVPDLVLEGLALAFRMNAEQD
ncbi:MAG TPA: type III pantothenate kinase [Elusimicrobia bacterium]|nr:type III pantothenate kinase [Elusimicrobiota bacterium]